MNPSTLSNEDLDRIIHEQVMGECWHEYINSNRCQKCFNINATEYNTDNPSYCTSWEDYGRLLDFLGVAKVSAACKGHFDILLKKRRGCEAIVEYFCKEG